MIPKPGQIWESQQTIYHDKWTDQRDEVKVPRHNKIFIVEVDVDHSGGNHREKIDIVALLSTQLVRFKQVNKYWWEDKFMRLFPEQWKPKPR